MDSGGYFLAFVAFEVHQEFYKVVYKFEFSIISYPCVINYCEHGVSERSFNQFP